MMVNIWVGSKPGKVVTFNLVLMCTQGTVEVNFGNRSTANRARVELETILQVLSQFGNWVRPKILIAEPGDQKKFFL